MAGRNSVSSSDDNEVEQNDPKNLRSRSQSCESVDSESQSPKSNKCGSPQRRADQASENSEINLSEEKKYEAKKECNTDLHNSSKQHESKTIETNKVDEEEFDYDAEDGECSGGSENEKSKKLEVCEKKVQEDLEEGEILDDDDDDNYEDGDSDGKPKLEVIEPRVVCKFFMRGQCSWGVNCRFLHSDIPNNRNAYYERSLRTTKDFEQEQNIRDEESHHGNGIESSSEVIYTRHPPTRRYSSEKYTRNKQKIYEPEYSKDSKRSSSHYYDKSYRSSDYHKREVRDLYKSKRPKREISVSREREGWSDPWMRSKSAAGAKRKRDDSSSSYSSSGSSSRSSSSSKSSHGRSYDGKKQNSRREIVPVSSPIKRNSLVDEFGRSRKKITTTDKEPRRGKETKRSTKSVSTTSSSSSSSDSDSSPVSKTRSRRKRRRSDTNLKNDKISKEILIKRLKHIEGAIANYKKKSTN